MKKCYCALMTTRVLVETESSVLAASGGKGDYIQPVNVVVEDFKTVDVPEWETGFSRDF